MKRIAIVSALMISLSLTNANAEACPSSHISGRCAAAHHQVKHAKRSNMGGALIGAYHR
jgi:hypothetical protein